jgi:hypothetical protein
MTQAKKNITFIILWTPCLDSRYWCGIRGTGRSAFSRGVMKYQITIRYGRKSHRYFSLTLEAPDAVAALRKAADEVPAEITPEVDIVELREAPDFEKTLPPSEGV